MSNKLSADWDIDECSILMFGEDFPCLCVQCWKPQRKTHIQDLNRILYRFDGEFAVSDSLQCIYCPRSYFFIFQKC